MSKEYKGKAAIQFIDVWEHQEEAHKYGILTIPTQIFYAKNGEETYCHQGSMDKESIVAELQKLGVK